LITFLAVLALYASFLLSALTDRWTSGMENKITIEIPARNSDGSLLEPEQIEATTRHVADRIGTVDGIAKIEVLSKDDIARLVEPWLGGSIDQVDFPLPGIVTVTLARSDTKTMQAMHAALRAVSSTARMDTHEDWLRDILRLTGGLQLGAVILVMIITATTLTSVAAAVRSRMAIHHAEVEILHIMGASDSYITRQFQRHALVLALKGALCGAVCAMVAVWVIGLIAGEAGVSILPSFRMNSGHYMMLLAVPLVIAGLSMMTARWTVLKSLAAFP
jgi:cell division transport system permease protein